ncbi:hypothetical protein D6825_01395 [Candidatus Woesearchaeota archaeon]|nr:MAG: hypothetical protein D6825_01395 [Candidatus Woesearchaeota archaeon]
MNSKGLDYAALLVLITLAGSAMLYLQVSKKWDAINSKQLGELQESILEVESQVRLYEAFVRSAARRSIEKVALSSIRKPSLQGFEGVGCSVLNSFDNPRVLLSHDLFNALSKELNSEIDKYLLEYNRKAEGVSAPLNNFVFYFEKGRVKGVALKPTIFSRKGLVFSVRPSFDVIFPHMFERYVASYEVLESIAERCALSADVESCAKDVPQGWSVERSGDRFTFKVPFNVDSACYVLFLPGQSLDSNQS